MKGPTQIANHETITLSKWPEFEDSHQCSDGSVYTFPVSGLWSVDGVIKEYKAGDTIPLGEIKHGLCNVCG